MIILFLFSSLANAQYIMQVNVLGGEQIPLNGTISIDAGSALTFRITNAITQGCGDVRVRDITLTDNLNFSVSTTIPTNVKPDGCKGDNYYDFTVTAKNTVCGTYFTDVEIHINTGTFKFRFEVKTSPIISVLGGSPLADILDGATTTSATNGTYFGVVEVGGVVSRTYIITNTGSCPLDISTITSSNPTFPIYIQADSPIIAPGAFTYFVVVYSPNPLAPTTSTITIPNTTSGSSNPYTFNVSATIFNIGIPGPGGVTTNFRLWLKSTRGVVIENPDPNVSPKKVKEWKDLGVNGESAAQTNTNLQPTYLNNVGSNINFNPVIKFENDGNYLNQYLENANNGFYSQDIFIVMEPDVDVANSTRMAIFSGTVSNYTNIRGTFPGNANYDNDGDGIMNDIDENDLNLGNDVTSVGLGNLHATERLWYNQGSATSNPYYNLAGSLTRSYAKAGIINAHNKTETPSDGMRMSFNSVNDNIAATNSNNFTFTNLGYVQSEPVPTFVWGTPYKIGKNAHSPYGNLNGRVAEIMTFAQRVPDADRPKIETYLAIKYGITLGETQAEKNYVNSAGNAIWDINTGIPSKDVFNYNIAGIGRADNSDLNQKQSKSVNDANEVTIGLDGIFATNSANINEFKNDGDFLVWGSDNGAFTGASTNTVTIATGITTSLTRIDRKWKIVESKVDEDGDVENVFVGIPSTAFSGFTKTTEEEFVLIVSETENFADADIVDVVPLKIASTMYGITLDKEGNSSYQTWYDFDGTKYFTFGKAPKLTRKSAVNIAEGDYLVGEYALNLNINAFTISAWVRGVNPSAIPRTIMAKGTKLQLRLNTESKVEVMVDNDDVPRFISNMALTYGKWHNVSFVYASGTVFLYIDGILDKSEQGVNPPTPNYNRFSIGAVYISKKEDEIINPFLGEIEEVYVWDQGLSQDQVRYLMNQEVEIITGNFVKGKALPYASPNNEIANIPWSKLKGYYDFNTFYGTTVEGLTAERNFLRIKYLDKTKTITNTQTAPLPYVTAAVDGVDGVWDSPDTWANSSTQMLPNSLGLDGLTTIDWNIVEISHNITSGARNIEVLGLKINSEKKITIDGTLDLVSGTGTGHGLGVSHYLKLDGEINLAGESQLVQGEGSILDEKSGGYLDKDQQGTASSYNYNYWSSSVGPITPVGAATGIASPNLSFSVKGNMLDGTTPINFQTAHSAADLAVTPTPIIISSYWLYKFYGPDDAYSAWIKIGATTLLGPGEGYTMKGTSKLAAITTNQNYKFRGKPYNGTITLALDKTSGDVDRLIGNPYPSAIDANEFILDNIKSTDTINGEAGRNAVNVFNGALYFWHHFSGASHYLAEYVGGYATYTLMGGVEAYSTDSRINNSTPEVGGGKIPERYIPVNQGFFVITALPSGISGTTTTVEGGEIIFKNSQRVFVKEGDAGEFDGSLFFKGSKKTNAKQIRETREEQPKIRLQFTSPKGYVRQLLVGLADNATNHFDIGYDAPLADVNKDDMFWTFDNAKFVIQAVRNFNTDQELPLGVKIAKAGLVTIKIDKLENMDDDISLHIKDNLTGETHNISKKEFKIDLGAGSHLDRFVLIFKMQKLVAEDVPAEVSIINEQIIIEGIHVFMNNSIGELQIKNNSPEEILSVELFNSLGQRINNWNKNLNRRIISLPINAATGVYIVQINTKTGKTVKKISVE
ncbi:MAG: LamG-like jellyroll fold domain-containing protein [Lutibacter sp.]|nr:LamG-like jellyroll fold domain-containing protein [Lutibacter sp.]